MIGETNDEWSIVQREAGDEIPVSSIITYAHRLAVEYHQWKMVCSGAVGSRTFEDFRRTQQHNNVLVWGSTKGFNHPFRRSYLGVGLVRRLS